MFGKLFASLFASVGCAGASVILALPLACVAAWVEHVVFTIQHQEWILLLVGALCFPIGVIHGFGLWFGWFVY